MTEVNSALQRGTYRAVQESGEPFPGRVKSPSPEVPVSWEKGRKGTAWAGSGNSEQPRGEWKQVSVNEVPIGGSDNNN